MARNPKTSSRKQVEKEFAVIGLGRFGGSLARRLEGMGHTVLGVDSDMARVQEIAEQHHFGGCSRCDHGRARCRRSTSLPSAR